MFANRWKKISMIMIIKKKDIRCLQMYSYKYCQQSVLVEKKQVIALNWGYDELIIIFFK
jgi:hypothetical protein